MVQAQDKSTLVPVITSLTGLPVSLHLFIFSIYTAGFNKYLLVTYGPFSIGKRPFKVKVYALTLLIIVTSPIF